MGIAWSAAAREAWREQVGTDYTPAQGQALRDHARSFAARVQELVPGLPPNHSTYALTFDPTRPDTLYAPNHFGRGFLHSTDAGTSWSVSTTGLPDAIDLSRRIDDLVVTSTGRLLLATRSGLYVSDDGGQTFEREDHPTLATSTDLRALATHGDLVVAGSYNGRLYVSPDGEDWDELTTKDGLPISDIAVTASSLYVAYTQGTVVRLDFFGGALTINDPFAGDPASGLYTQLAVVPGATPRDDHVWVGLVPIPERGNQLWVSTDGGETLTLRSDGLDGAHVFSMAVDPADPAHAVVGTVGEGLFATFDAGQSWVRGTGELPASAVLGFAEDPADADHLLVSVTEGLTGTRGVYETVDAGTSWVPVDAVPVDVRPLLITSTGTALAGAFDGGGGVARRAAGSTRWDLQLRGDELNAFAEHPDGSLWAVGVGGAWRSDDDGATWVHVHTPFTTAVAIHPDGSVVLCGDTRTFASTDGFRTPGAELGRFPSFGIESCSFADDDTLLVGTGFGRLYRGDGYTPDGGSMLWEQVDTPIEDASIRSVVVGGAGRPDAWYASAVAPDVYFTPRSSSGLWRSDDEGQTWVSLADHLYPGTLVWGVVPSVHRAEHYVMMWGGGGLRGLTDR